MRVKLDPGAYLPERAHDTDAGLDLRTPVDAYIRAGGSTVIDTGVHIQLPPGTVGMLKSKSGLNVKDGIVSRASLTRATPGPSWSSCTTTARRLSSLAGGTRSPSWWCCRCCTSKWSRRRRSRADPEGTMGMGVLGDEVSTER